MTRVAMWSGPRNISTAMMRAWENRGDTVVWDEPFYAHYLQYTGIDHPMKAEVIAAGEPSWEKVVTSILAPTTDDKPVFFQKHMTHHLLPHMSRDWIREIRNCFLIRDPIEVVASYVRKREQVMLADIGVTQQAELFDYVTTTTGVIPPVIDAKEVLTAPREVLTSLCRSIGIDFTDSMLSWPAGHRDSDGVWGAHWYHSVATSTGFKPYQSKTCALDGSLLALAQQAYPYYLHMHAHRITTR